MFNGRYIEVRNPDELITQHVTVDEVKQQLNLLPSETEDEPFITRLIEAASKDARAHCDHYFDKVKAGYKLYNFSGSELDIPLCPYLSMDLIRVSDNGTDWTDLVENEDYIIQPALNNFGIFFADKVEYPYVEVSFYLGYENIPANAKHAIILKAADYFDSERSNYAPNKVANLMTYERLLEEYYSFRIK